VPEPWFKPLENRSPCVVVQFDVATRRHLAIVHYLHHFGQPRQLREQIADRSKRTQVELPIHFAFVAMTLKAMRREHGVELP
jgi:hypothetical protein